MIFLCVQENAEEYLRTWPSLLPSIPFPIQHAYKLKTNKIIFILLKEKKMEGVSKENWFPNEVVKHVQSHILANSSTHNIQKVVETVILRAHAQD